jgi:hypothetical protein
MFAKVLTLTALVCLPLFAKTPTRIAAEVEEGINADEQSLSSHSVVLQSLRDRVDAAMTSALNVAAEELDSRGYQADANDIRMTWAIEYHYSMFYESRNIGDHKPVSQWVADKYNTIEFLLGRDFCIKSHIADIKTINYAVPVVFRPCSFPMDNVQGERSVEYKRHFCGGASGDDTYNGLVPVVTYWAVYIGCSAATSGTGFVFVCGIAGTLGEKIIQNYVAASMSDRIYNKVCGGN